MKTSTGLLVPSMAAALFCVTTCQATVYVAPATAGGDDGNSGSGWDQPKLTISNAVAAAGVEIGRA
ncbi:MAG: hypothetical protein PHR35_22605, partial [Kiritimatiellae bacterium]|nr:hypothetical protein [Kiritimatiellia bacterium]